MTKRTNIIFAASFLVGMAGLQVYAWQIKEKFQGGQLRRVLITTQDIAAGEHLSADKLGVLDIPADYVDSRRILFSERENLVGVSLQNSLKAGDSLAWNDIADGAAQRHLADLVSPGKRAYRLEASTNALGRLLRVGDHVDVLLEARGESKVLLERLLVLAVGDSMANSGSILGQAMRIGGGVTVSVSNIEVQTLLQAESRGKLHLVLRNSQDFKKQVMSSENAEEASRGPRARQEPGRKIEHVQ